jgi:2-dehydropantoate 2-reductase
MKVAVIGAGAIGGLMGAALARAGTDTHLIARGAHLEAMRQNGLRIVTDQSSWCVRVPSTDDPEDIGPVDYVILGVKSYLYASIADLLEPLLDEHTAVMPAQNGIPWWYFYKHGGPYDGRRIESVDPGGSVSAVLAPQRVIGCVVYPAAVLTAPGVIHHVEGRRFAIGEPDGTESDRCRSFARALSAGGMKCTIDARIRGQIWVKLMGNATFNPISVLTSATMAEICRFPLTRDLAAAMMREAVAVATQLGCDVPVSIERRLAGAERVGEHRTSMLQDLHAGRRMEIEALHGAVVELADLTGVAVPRLRTAYATVSLLARQIGSEGATARQPLGGTAAAPGLDTARSDRPS